MSGNWFDQVAKFITDNLEDYAKQFLSPHKYYKSGKSLFINPCPFCGHNDCFSLTAGFNGAKCFSCDESGTLIQIAEKIHGEAEARRRLADWSGIPYHFVSHEPPEKTAANEKFQRLQRICHKAIDFYHRRLMNNQPVSDEAETKSPLEHQALVRKHTSDTLEKYKVGYSGGLPELYKLLESEGFERHEIKEAASQLIGLPEGYFVYPYYDSKGNLVRVNCKMFVRFCRGKENPNGGYHYDCNFKSFRKDDITKKFHESQTGHVMTSNNLSRGEKSGVFLIHPKDLKNKKKKYLILIEGEDDLLSTEEALLKLPSSYHKSFAVASIGGNAPQGLFEADFLRQYEEIYEAFDNDEAGDKYREQLDRELPDVNLKRIEIPEEYNDIDEFLKLEEQAIDLFKVMIDKAVVQTTKNYIVKKEANKHVWDLKNRHYHLKYEVNYFNHHKSGFNGNMLIFKNGLISDKKVGDIDAIKVPGEELTRLKLALSNSLVNYYNQIRWVKNEPQRTFEELIDIFHMTKQKAECTKQIAWYVFHAPVKEYEARIRQIQTKVRNEADVASILKEINGYENQEIDPFARFPKIQLSQSFFPKNGDGYMYFAKFVKDGETPKRVPCLISNKKEEIRLDLLKRKDAQCLLLINNKYELPIELEANLVDVEDLSLQYEWVNKWVKKEVSDFETHPSTIIREIEAFIRLTYYTSEDVIKVLSLWIYSTYFYTLFRSGFPYLVFNGAKGTGKSTLDQIVHLLAFNPTFTVSISGAALYRQVSIFGGTFILDELETISDSSKVNEMDLAAVIKAGYSDKGKVYRTNPDTNIAEGFTAFGPKVISNISGVEQVIGDRCIFITTYAAPEDKLSKLRDPEEFKGERRDEMYSITSRAAISALTHFQEVERIFHTDTRVDTGNARLTQILRPLVTIAKLVGGDYEQHLTNFYQSTIKVNKEEQSLDTLEGKIKYILLSVAEEVLGISKNPWVIGHDHLYERKITYDKNTGTFCIDTLHFKVFAEELDSEQNYKFHEIHTAIKNVMGREYDMKKNRAPTRITITDEGLLKQFNNKKYPHGYRFSFNIRNFISEQAEKLYRKETTVELF